MSSLLIIKEFEDVCTDIYGMYLDNFMGLQITSTHLSNFIKDQGVKQAIAEEEMLRLPFVHNDPFAETLYKDSFGTRLERIGHNGKSNVFLANMSLSSMYGYWNDHYRHVIAESLGKEKLLCDIFGDLGYIRQGILHTRQTANEKINKCKILTWFKVGDPIKLDHAKMKYIYMQIRNYLATLKSEAIGLTYEDANLHYEIAHALSFLPETHALAKQYFERAIELEPNSYLINMEYGNFLFKADVFEEAEKHYNKSVEINPDPLVLGNLANVLSKLGRFEEADKRYLEAIEKAPDHVVAYYNCAVFVCEKLNDIPRGKVYIQKAHEIEPTNLEILFYYAKVLKIINPEEIPSVLSILETPHPDNAYVNYHYSRFLAIIYEKPEEARPYYLRAIALEPDYKDEQLGKLLEGVSQ